MKRKIEPKEAGPVYHPIKTRVRYRRARFTVRFLKAGRCQACGAKGRTELHHIVYRYTTAQVRKEPQLATHHTIELCYKCHHLANMVLHIAEDAPRFRKVKEAIEERLVDISKEVRREGVVTTKP